jgi:LemA protein
MPRGHSFVLAARPSARMRATSRMRAVWLGASLLLALSTTGCGYNTIQDYDESAAKAQGQIETQLQRRADLIPNLVATVKGYAKQELDVLTNVTRARAGLVDAIQKGDPEQMANANAELTAQLAIVNRSVVEAYPELRSNEQFLRLQDELTGTENRIAVSRQDYNEAVNRYNAYIRKFPATVTARVTGAQPRKYFTASAGATTAPTVDFNTAPGGGAGTTPAATCTGR